MVLCGGASVYVCFCRSVCVQCCGDDKIRVAVILTAI